jgi:hypothetical protein
VNPYFIQLMVEGPGDAKAVPILLKRILKKNRIFDIDFPRPHIRGDLPKIKKNFTRFFADARQKKYPVLCVLDFDCDECREVEKEENNLKNEAEKLYPGYFFEACFIVKEFESLFLWDAKNTRKILPSIIDGYDFPEAPESIRDAKGELSKAQPKGYIYKPTIHQAELSREVDLDLLKSRSPSYQRLEKAVLSLGNRGR